MPLSKYSFFIGPLLGSYIIYLSYVFYISTLFALDQIVIFRTLYITNCNRMFTLNDDFLGGYLFAVNVLTGFLCGAIRKFMGEFEANFHVCLLGGFECDPKTDLIKAIFLL